MRFHASGESSGITTNHRQPPDELGLSRLADGTEKQRERYPSDHDEPGTDITTRPLPVDYADL
jgi:hypothetical protein